MPSDLDELQSMGIDTSSRRFGKPPPSPTPVPSPTPTVKSNLLRQLQIAMAGRQTNPSIVPPNAPPYRPIWPTT